VGQLKPVGRLGTEPAAYWEQNQQPTGNRTGGSHKAKHDTFTVEKKKLFFTLWHSTPEIGFMEK